MTVRPRLFGSGLPRHSTAAGKPHICFVSGGVIPSKEQRSTEILQCRFLWIEYPRLHKSAVTAPSGPAARSIWMSPTYFSAIGGSGNSSAACSRTRLAPSSRFPQSTRSSRARSVSAMNSDTTGLPAEEQPWRLRNFCGLSTREPVTIDISPRLELARSLPDSSSRRQDCRLAPPGCHQANPPNRRCRQAACTFPHSPERHPTPRSELRQSEVEQKITPAGTKFACSLEILDRFGKFAVSYQQFRHTLPDHQLVRGVSGDDAKRIDVGEIHIRSQLRFQKHQSGFRSISAPKIGCVRSAGALPIAGLQCAAAVASVRLSSSGFRALGLLHFSTRRCGFP